MKLQKITQIRIEWMPVVLRVYYLAKFIYKTMKYLVFIGHTPHTQSRNSKENGLGQNSGAVTNIFGRQTYAILQELIIFFSLNTNIISYYRSHCLAYIWSFINGI